MSSHLFSFAISFRESLPQKKGVEAKSYFGFVGVSPLALPEASEERGGSQFSLSKSVLLKHNLVVLSLLGCFFAASSLRRSRLTLR